MLGRGGDRRLAELELAAQAEHGPDAVCAIVEGDDLEAALAEVERRAPEHVALLGEAESLAPRIRNAGAVFVGASSPVPTGDLGTGGNHVLPTGGWARSVGGLGLETFLKPVTVQRLTPAGLALVRPTVEALAAARGIARARGGGGPMRAAGRASSRRTPGRRRPRSSPAAPGSTRSRSSASTATSRRCRCRARAPARSRARSRT